MADWSANPQHFNDATNEQASSGHSGLNPFRSPQVVALRFARGEVVLINLDSDTLERMTPPSARSAARDFHCRFSRWPKADAGSRTDHESEFLGEFRSIPEHVIGPKLPHSALSSRRSSRAGHRDLLDAAIGLIGFNRCFHSSLADLERGQSLRDLESSAVRCVNPLVQIRRRWREPA